MVDPSSWTERKERLTVFCETNIREKGAGDEKKAQQPFSGFKAKGAADLGAALTGGIPEK